jgi:hypothetical protein
MKELPMFVTLISAFLILLVYVLVNKNLNDFFSKQNRNILGLMGLSLVIIYILVYCIQLIIKMYQEIQA